MSNVKRIELDLWVPWNCDNSNKLLRVLGLCALPDFGLTAAFYPDESVWAETPWGSKRLYHHLVIWGMEAMRDEYLEDILSEVRRVGGLVADAHVYDTGYDETVIQNTVDVSTQEKLKQALNACLTAHSAAM